MPEENKPSLTGEEVSDEQLRAFLSETHYCGFDGKLNALRKLLSTVRAQDKADAEEALRGRMEYLKEMGFEYGYTWDEAISGVAALRAEVARLNAEVEELLNGRASWNVTAKEWSDSLSSLSAEVAAWKETASGNRLMMESARREAGEAKAERDDLRTRLAQVEKKVHDERLSRTVTWSKLVSEHEAARDLAEQWVVDLEQHMVETIHGIRLASQCPAGADLAAWVGQLAEDKRHLEDLDSLVDEGDSLTIMVEDGGVILFRNGNQLIEPADSLRSAIDASNPKP